MNRNNESDLGYYLFLISAAIALATVGCSQPMLTVNDVIAINGLQTTFDAYAEHVAPLGDVDRLLGVKVTFLADGKEIGAAATDRHGFARYCCHVPPGAKSIEGRARVDGRDVRGLGQIFTWDPKRTTVVCDIDETISATNYSTLIDDQPDDTGSKPLPGAPEAVRRLSERFNILYVSARPRFLLEKTRRWLACHQFPPAPVITTPSLAEAIRVQKFKGRTIADLQMLSDNLLIGIGNARTDSEAYAANGLLTLIIDHRDTNRFRSHAIVLNDWAMVEKFFDANKKVLEEPARLRSAIAGEEFLLRPIIKWQK